VVKTAHIAPLIAIRGGVATELTLDMFMLNPPCHWEPDWSSVFDADRKQAAQSRRRFLGQVADTSTLILSPPTVQSGARG
jgi:hypothetical protein